MKTLVSTNHFGCYLLWLFCLQPIISHAAEQNNNAYLSQRGQLPTPQAIRDPFTPSSLMFDVVAKQSGSAGFDSYGFMRSPNNAGIPQMRLRGFVTQDKNDAVALLEVAGVRTFLVREGDEINIDPSQPNSAIRITKITRLSVTVETGTLGSIRVQR